MPHSFANHTDLLHFDKACACLGKEQRVLEVCSTFICCMRFTVGNQLCIFKYGPYVYFKISIIALSVWVNRAMQKYAGQCVRRVCSFNIHLPTQSESTVKFTAIFKTHTFNMQRENNLSRPPLVVNINMIGSLF